MRRGALVVSSAKNVSAMLAILFLIFLQSRTSFERFSVKPDNDHNIADILLEPITAKDPAEDKAVNIIAADAAVKKIASTIPPPSRAESPFDQHPRTSTSTSTSASTQMPISSTMQGKNHNDDSFQFKYKDAMTRFPLPAWLDKFLTSQPTTATGSTQNDIMLSDPNAKFIVMTCYKYETVHWEKCGGLSDRLFSLPYYIWLANKTGRKLFIKYGKPHPMEEFFVPPQEGGFDWRVPDGYFDKEWEDYSHRGSKEMRDQRRYQWHRLIETPEWNDTRVIFVNANLAIPMTSLLFTEATGLETYDVWPGIFRRFFQPSKALAKIIDSIAEEHGLIPGQYSSAHVRAKYPVDRVGQKEIKILKNEKGLNMQDARTHEIITAIADNAMHCAMKAMPKAKHVYFASDAHELATYLMKESPTWAVRNRTSLNLTQKPPSGVTIVTRPNHTVEPEHYGFSMDPDPRKYDGIFIDLWIMAHAKCMAQGVGGFGHFASSLSGNHYSCRVRHRDYKVGISPSCPTPGAENKAVRHMHEASIKAAAEEAKAKAEQNGNHTNHTVQTRS